MAKKKQIDSEIEQKSKKRTKVTKKAKDSPAKKPSRSVAKPAEKKAKKTESKVVDKKTAKKPTLKKAKKTESKTTDKKQTKKTSEKKTGKPEKKKAKKPEKVEEPKTLEEELEEQLTDEEIENFQIEKVDMDKLTNKVCEIIAKFESSGMLQSELWKKLKLSSRDGSRLALKLERMGIITREKILEKGRWTYKLILKKTPISTLSIENAPCLICPVEQKCSLEGEVSPRTCQWIEEWVIAEIKKPKKEK